VFVGVTGGRHRAQREPAQVDILTVAEREVRELPPAGGGGEDRRAVPGGELERAGEEVRVQVGVGGVRDAQPSALGRGADGPQVPAHVDRQGPAVAEIEQVRRIAQPLVNDELELAGSQR
jgi:hypothetical protein